MPIPTLNRYLLLFTLCSSSAWGSPAASGNSPDSDLEVMRKLVEPFVYELSKPFTVYNWHHADTPDELSATATAKAKAKAKAKAPKAYAALQAMTERYWDKQTRPRQYYRPVRNGPLRGRRPRLLALVREGRRLGAHRDGSPRRIPPSRCRERRRIGIAA